jgi:hypothetical protein
MAGDIDNLLAALWRIESARIVGASRLRHMTPHPSALNHAQDIYLIPMPASYNLAMIYAVWNCAVLTWQGMHHEISFLGSTRIDPVPGATHGALWRQHDLHRGAHR